MVRPARCTPDLVKKYIEGGYWEDVTLVDMWDRNARDYPDKEALVDSQTRLTWSQSKRIIDRLALGFLETGIKRDEVMVIQLPNCVELFLLRIACAKAGILCVPALRTLREAEMEYILKHVEPAAIVIPWKFKGFDYFSMVKNIQPVSSKLRYVFVKGDDVPPGAINLKDMMLQPIEQKYPEGYLGTTKYGATDTSVILLTTGTTGFPKFVEFPACARLYSTGERIKDIKLSSNDVVGAVLPAAMGPNAIAYFGAPRVAAKVVILESFEPEAALALIDREKVTCLGMVPTALSMMIKQPSISKYDLSSLRLVLTDAASLSYQLGIEAEKTLRCPVVQDFGAVDFGGITMCSLYDPLEIRLSTVGKPYPGNEIMLTDEDGNAVGKGEVGEIWARGPTSVSSYYRDPLTTKQMITENGWFKTGDLGKFDVKGNLIIAGRRKDMIIRGGQNIYPTEIENLLVTHPKVSAVAVVAMPDALMGERACAYVVSKHGQEFTLDEMLSFLRMKNIAPYKLPERLEILDKLPMVGELKIDKKVLLQDIIQKLKSEGKI